MSILGMFTLLAYGGWIALGAVVLLVLWFLGAYNGLVSPPSEPERASRRRSFYGSGGEIWRPRHSRAHLVWP